MKISHILRRVKYRVSNWLTSLAKARMLKVSADYRRLVEFKKTWPGELMELLPAKPMSAAIMKSLGWEVGFVWKKRRLPPLAPGGRTIKEELQYRHEDR